MPGTEGVFKHAACLPGPNPGSYLLGICQGAMGREGGEVRGVSSAGRWSDTADSTAPCTMRAGSTLVIVRGDNEQGVRLNRE